MEQISDDLIEHRKVLPSLEGVVSLLWIKPDSSY